MKDRRVYQILPIGTKAIWLYFNGVVDAFKRVTVVGHHKDGLGGKWVIVEDENGIQKLAGIGMLIKVYD